MLNNQESSASCLASLIDFINVLLRGECPKQMRELMFGGSLIALSKKSGGLRPIVIGYTYRRLAAKCALLFCLPLQPALRSMRSGSGSVILATYRWEERYALGRLDSFLPHYKLGWRSQGAEKQQYMRQEASSQ